MPRALLNAYARLEALLGRGVLLTVGFIALATLALALAGFAFVSAAAPTSLTLTSGPPGSAFERYAKRYQAVLAKEGVTLHIQPSQGSHENLRRLSDAKSPAEVGFVLGGEVKVEDVPPHLASLGSVAYQPLMVFYRGKPRTLLSDFKGARIDIGPEGSGSYTLAKALLAANGIDPGKPGETTQIVDLRAEDTAQALRAGRIDAFFAMSDSTPNTLIRQLLLTPEIHLYDFAQADGYARRFSQLNKLFLPRGALDFGADIPSDDIWLVGPTVELVARDSLHPALSDLLLEAARQVHGRAGLYKKRGEFPAPQEHEFRISPDATRYYTNGRSFLYRTFPFWLASLIARILAVVVPLTLLLIPAVRIVPALYRWRMSSRVYRWYGELRRLEREAERAPVTEARRAELLQQLDRIEAAVHKIVVPSAFGDLFYGLRSHITVVRSNLAGAS